MTRLYAFAAAALLSLSSTETFAFTTFRSYTHNGRRTGLETSIHGMPNLPIEIPPVKEILSPADEFLRSIDSATDAVIQDAYENVFVKVSSLAHEVMSSSVVDEFSKQYAAHPEIAEILKQIEHVISELPPSAALIGSAVVTYVLASSALDKLSGEPEAPYRPYPLNKYDATSAAAYFSVRPLMVLKRALEVFSLSAKFTTDLAFDFLNNRIDENSDTRSLELAKLLTNLGPSFIKIGQSLSIRTDILSPAYVRGLKSLQDQVPPFSSIEAREILESELGGKLESIFESPFPSEPIAAASLGQVYRARLKSSGQEVAVKVQRPDIMTQIALDMYLIRDIVAPILKRFFTLNTDLVGVTDTWGIGFVDELDYTAEANNAKFFTESIQSTPLADVVFSPTVVDKYTTDKVLTTEWIVGERLDKSSQSDVTILTSIAMNSYLTMLLETGVLHCDPHPGNLLRTEDGRLCILDWGMVTRIDPDLQVTLIEHMAHLTSADYAEIPRDLLLLGFIPEDKAGLIADSGVVETLAEIYGAWTKGGGAAKINVPKVVSQLQNLTATKGNLFQIPPYFAYIAKSFSVLEGIGLSNDENYSIINECLPYVSKRLLTDKSTRTGGALSTFIFGANKTDKNRIIDYKRAEQLVSGFADYSTSASGALLGKDVSDTKVIEEQADQILELLLADEEDELTPLQEIFLEQLAKIISSSSRGVWGQIRQASGTLPSGRSVLGTLIDPIGFWRTSPAVAVSEMDKRTIETTRSLIKLLQDNSGVENISDLTGQLTNQQIVDVMSTVSRKLWTRRSSVFKTGRKLALNLIQLTADKLEEGERVTVELHTTSSEQATNDGRIHSSSNPARSRSRRLEDARRMMEKLESEENYSRPPTSSMASQALTEEQNLTVQVDRPVSATIHVNNGKCIEYDDRSSRFYEKSDTL